MTLDRLNDSTMTFPSHGDRRAYAAEQKLATLRAALASLEQEMRAAADGYSHLAEWDQAEVQTRQWADRIAALLQETP